MSKLYVNSISPSTSATISIVSASFSATTISASDIVGNVSNALTASLATTASYVLNAVTASYVLNAISSSFATTASYALNAISSSFATTASYALNGGVTQIVAGTNVTISGGTGAVTINSSGGTTFPYTGSAIISGSLVVTGSISTNKGFTGSLLGTATNATSASYATTASFAEFAELSNISYFAHTISNPLNQNVAILGYISVSGSIYVSGSILPSTNVGSSTSSFSLGSATQAWKDIYVSDGTINFVNGSGQTIATIGAGTNATIITGSLVVVPAGDEEFVLENFTASYSQFARVRDNMASLFIGSGSAGSNGLLNFASLAGYNPSLYQYVNNNGAYIYTLPWDKKIHNFFLKNNLQGGELEIPQPIYIGLPPILNAGYVSGDIINIYNFTSGSGATLDAVNQTGSLYITSIAQGVSTLNTSTKLISGRVNSSVTLLSGSWNNYVRFDVDDLALLTPTLTDCIKLNPGQKAQFEVVQWGTISGDTSKIPRNSVADDYGYLLNRYGYAQGYISPGDTTNINTLYGMIYLFRGIENL